MKGTEEIITRMSAVQLESSRRHALELDTCLRELAAGKVPARCLPIPVVRSESLKLRASRMPWSCPGLRTHGGVLSFLSTITVFGTAVDISLSELSLEAFYPADEATAVALRRTSAQQPTS